MFPIASRDTCIEAINIANICVNTSRKLEDIDAIIVFVDIISSLYIDRSSNSS